MFLDGLANKLSKSFHFVNHLLLDTVWASDCVRYGGYADPANGAVHILAPGALLLFPSPVDLPEGEQWSPALRFAAAFYANLGPVSDARPSSYICWVPGPHGSGGGRGTYAWGLQTCPCYALRAIGRGRPARVALLRTHRPCAATAIRVGAKSRRLH
jgi:hypothetical protein